MSDANLTYWCAGDSCCDEVWEQAYLDFETPEQERIKFHKRYRRLGVDRWPKSLAVAELFCGRGNGLLALEELGFTDVEGVDLSPRLLRGYEGRARRYVGDCRDLKWPANSKDVVVVQGGLHHLGRLPDDLDAVLDEIVRVLRSTGRFVLIEPWRTPFLSLAHAITNRRLVRRCYPRGNALAVMTEREWDTYDQWLAQPRVILQSLRKRFSIEQQIIGWGKLMLVALPRETSAS